MSVVVAVGHVLMTEMVRKSNDSDWLHTMLWLCCLHLSWRH
jgi:hypothetical protein